MQFQLHGNQNYLNFIKKNHLSMYILALFLDKISSMGILVLKIIINHNIEVMEVEIFHLKEIVMKNKMSKNKNLVQRESSMILCLNFNITQDSSIT